jgi:hypothetical protein
MLSSSVYITLDSPPEFYTAGDKIKGHVVLDTVKEETITSVTITFTGRGKVKIDRYDSSDNHR